MNKDIYENVMPNKSEPNDGTFLTQHQFTSSDAFERIMNEQKSN